MNGPRAAQTLAVVAAAALAAACQASAPPRVEQPAAPVAPTAPAARTTPTVVPSARERLLAAEAAHSAATAAEGLADGFVRFLADDAVYLAPGAPVVRGKEAVRALVSAAPSSAMTGLRWKPVRADMSDDATAGYSYGYAEWRSPDTSGAPSAGYGKYISFWRRNERGDWRVAAFVLAPSPGPPPSAAPPPSFASTFASPAVTSSAGAAPRDERASAAARAAMMATDSAFAARSLVVGITAAFAEYVAPDGAVLSGTPSIVYGPGAIGARPTPRTVKLVWAPIIGEVAPSGDLGFTVGEARLDAPGDDGAMHTSYTKYLSVWKKQPSGAWRYVVDGGNERPGPN